MAYRPVGGVEEFVGMCGEDVFFQAGFYEGVIEFHGEGGFTDVSTTWARGRPTAFPCGGTLYTGGTGIDGAVLTAISFRRERQLFFEAHRNSPSSPAVFNARLYEANGDVALQPHSRRLLGELRPPHEGDRTKRLNGVDFASSFGPKKK